MPDIEKIKTGIFEMLQRNTWLGIDDDRRRLQPILNDALELLKKQSKKGHWIIDEYDYLDCSVCGESYYTGCVTTEEAKKRLANGEHYKFCPYCGADMRGEHE